MNISLKTGLLALVLAAGASTPAAGAARSPQAIHVAITGFQFVPARIEARVGDTIEWTNRDFAPHTATQVAGKWRTPTLKNGASGSIKLTAAGTFPYKCQFHPQMLGTIVVTPDAASGLKR